MGVPGPDGGNGGRHLIVPPGWDGEAPEGYCLARSTTYRMFAGVRSLPVGGDVQGANDRIQTIKVYPLDPSADWTEPSWLDLSGQPQGTTPGGLGDQPGLLAGPAVRERRLLRGRPSRRRRPREVVLPGHRRFTGHVPSCRRRRLPVLARPARRRWSVSGWGQDLPAVHPSALSGKLFWSISVYDAETRSQIRTDQNQAALRSLFELADAGADAPLDHYFGPQQATSGQSPANRVLSCGVTSGERTNGMTARPPTTLFARLGQRALVVVACARRRAACLARTHLGERAEPKRRPYIVN